MNPNIILRQPCQRNATRAQAILMNKENLSVGVWEFTHTRSFLKGKEVFSYSNITTPFILLWLIIATLAPKDNFLTFYRAVEILNDRYYTLGARFEYMPTSGHDVFCENRNIGHIHPVETVWGGDGEQLVTSMESDIEFHFEKVFRNHIRSSWSNGQIPSLYYI